jgi:hypothetical protein
MKRYRILRFDFDSRPTILGMKIEDWWEEDVKKLHHENKAKVRQGLIDEFGAWDAGQKEKDFLDLGPAPFSIIAFHNKFLRQLRTAFVMGAYYPSLTAACALGERILNHLILRLRNFYKSSPEYKSVYQKQSFDNWDIPINALSNWGVLVPPAITAFRGLKDIRNKVIHFEPDTDHNDRQLALDAVSKLSQVIGSQFTAHGTSSWFIPGAIGTTFIRKAAENEPFVREIYLPNCFKVGPLHRIDSQGAQWILHDAHPYEDREITDEEFVRMANAHSLTP